MADPATVDDPSVTAKNAQNVKNAVSSPAAMLKRNLIMNRFFAPSGTYPPAGLFSPFHIIMLMLSAAIIVTAVLLCRHAKASFVRRQIQILSLVLCALEIIKIVFNLLTGHADSPNSYVPLYFCSITMYAGLMAGFAKGEAKRIGEVFLATGGIIGGLAYLIYPLTSLTIYPPFHFISFHSFAFHTIMVYLGFLMLTTDYIKLRPGDAFRHALIICAVSLLALILNLATDSNLMFISRNYPGTFLEILYNLFPGASFTIVMVLSQAFGPFYLVYPFWYLAQRKKPQEDPASEMHDKEVGNPL